MDKSEMFRLRLAGMTYAHIGAAANISRQRVQQLLAPALSVRRGVVAIANGLCAGCGMAVGESGAVHHQARTGVDEEDYNDFPNLVLLCLRCHFRVHGEERRRNRNLSQLVASDPQVAEKALEDAKRAVATVLLIEAYMKRTGMHNG